MDFKSKNLKENVLSILTNKEMKHNLEKVQSYIQQSYGNKGGAELIIKYYNDYD